MQASHNALFLQKIINNLALSTPLTTFSRVRLSLREAKTPMNETINIMIPRRIRIMAGAKNTPSRVL